MSIHDHKATAIDGSERALGDFAGKAVLIVNVASRCGFTPQYAGLQKLYDAYKDRGFEILGFPCNQFLEQEPGTNEQIAEFCSVNFGVNFPLFAKVDVNGDDRHPLYAELSEHPDHKGRTGDIGWNFEKFLVSPKGEVVGRFSTRVEPESEVLTKAIEEQLPN